MGEVRKSFNLTHSVVLAAAKGNAKGFRREKGEN